MGEHRAEFDCIVLVPIDLLDAESTRLGGVAGVVGNQVADLVA
jgi:hypothetical protein